ncbi:MAG TPA: histidine kinase N-terminal 7TM domain-containing protein [Bacteroidales bacterium]|nr:histidine kinase N-terminal 7TM domain-containing protein [Bacteroidales bacterium]
MDYQYSILCYIRFLSGILALVLVFYLWRKRNAQGARYLMLFEILVAVWAFSDGMEAAAPAISQKLLWSQIGYIGIANSAVMFFMFSLSYTRNLSFSRNKPLLLILAVPLITIVLAFTNTWHKLLWSNIVLVPGTNRSIYYYGPWFWVNVSYQYALLVSGLVLIIAGAVRVYSIHRIQTWLLVFSALLPFVASILYVFKLTPVKGIDFTPVAFIFTGIVIGFSIYRLEFFSILPIAHRQTIDNLEDGIVILDIKGRVMNINPSFTQITGMTDQHIIGQDSGGILDYFGLSQDSFNEGNEFRNETGIEKSGEQKYYELKLQPISDKYRRRIGSLLTIRDITLTRMILDTIAESNQNRKKELEENEVLIRDLEAYARMVAHDLKNPLGSVISFTYLIQDAIREGKIADASEMVDMLQGESNKMNRIIDDLLILSRIRKEDIRIAKIDIGSIVKEALHRQHNLIARKNAVITTPDTWPEVYGQSQWVEQVWINLINNALKYGGTPPVITIGFEKTGQAAVRFFIRDNGNGLPAGSLKKLFTDFERLGNRDKEGTGLGLSIVKRIINKMGGEIFAESPDIPGEGCTFSFTLLSERK